jgi:SAM-dependent methyltransferase
LRLESFDESWETRMYGEGKQLNRYPYGDLVSRVLRLYSGKKIRVLELGSGAGANLAFFAKEGFETYGIEGSATAVRHARRFLDAQSLEAEIVHGDFTSLPYRSGYFDLIVDRESVCHNRWAAILAVRDEVRRCLKPGGRFLAFSFSRAHGAIKSAGGQRIEPGTYSDFKRSAFADAGTTHFFTEREMRAGYFKGFKLEYLHHQRCDSLRPGKRNEYAEFVALGRKP